ncbi:hypothetical protein Cha6605_2027 [Chamaesiphon minutus PCC 6605]|uniref:Uncharacterized protein n=1 Tax=Chamaesiphon minutus (strain ATCC 27169 / PCC 6605) TaxID=1173020 RepID=K9UFB3_CHAP6|nr:hypothetical protein Cha6605_2027 [Chamaesiphon minutus PCC 6605]
MASKMMSFYSNLTSKLPNFLKKLGTSAVAALTIAEISLISSIPRAQAAYYCQCVDYVKQVSGIANNIVVGIAAMLLAMLEPTNG